MPTAYIQKVADTSGIALEKLEEYWNKAKQIAKKKKESLGEDYWAYVMGIFQNMASLNGISVSAAYESISKKASIVVPKKKAKPMVKPKKLVAPGINKKTAAPGINKKVAAPGLKKPPKPKTIAKPKRNVVRKATKPAKATKLPEWWRKKTEMAKKKYIEKYPGSKFANNLAKTDPKVRKILVAAKKKAGIKTSSITDAKPEAPKDEEPKNASGKTVDETLPKEKNDSDKSPVAPTPKSAEDSADKKKEKEEFDKSQKKYKNIFHKAYHTSRRKINHALKANRVGMKAIGHFLKGHELGENEKKAAQGWAATAAKLVVGVAVGAALFTPLAGMAPELGSHFLKLVGKSMGLPDVSGDVSESSDDKKEPIDLIIDTDKNFQPADFTDKLHDWLMTQDIPALIEQLKSEGVKK